MLDRGVRTELLMEEKLLLILCQEDDTSSDASINLSAIRSRIFIETTPQCETISNRLRTMMRLSLLSLNIITFQFLEEERLLIQCLKRCRATPRSQHLPDRSEDVIEETDTWTHEWRRNRLRTRILIQGILEWTLTLKDKKYSMQWWKRRSLKCSCSRWRIDWRNLKKKNNGLRTWSSRTRRDVKRSTRWGDRNNRRGMRSKHGGTGRSLSWRRRRRRSNMSDRAWRKEFENRERRMLEIDWWSKERWRGALELEWTFEDRSILSRSSIEICWNRRSSLRSYPWGRWENKDFELSVTRTSMIRSNSEQTRITIRYLIWRGKSRNCLIA